MKSILLAASTAVMLTGAAVAGPVLVAPSLSAATAKQSTPKPPIVAAEYRTARVTDAFGSVERQGPGDTAKSWHTVSVGDLLPEKTALRTGSNGAALLQLPHNHLMRVGAGTTLVLRQLNDANQFSFKVLSGQVWSLVRKANHPTKYEVETPSAVAGVTGTIFSVSADAQTGETVVSTDEGSVQVRDGRARAAVTGGNYLSVFRRVQGGGQPPLHTPVQGGNALAFSPLQAHPQPDAMRQMWDLLRREGILDRRRDRDNTFSPAGGNGFRPLRLQRDLEPRLYHGWHGLPPAGRSLDGHRDGWMHRRREPGSDRTGRPNRPAGLGLGPRREPLNPAALPPVGDGVR